jgi:hypothetical protein
MGAGTHLTLENRSRGQGRRVIEPGRQPGRLSGGYRGR